MTLPAVTGEILDATDIASYDGCATDEECYATIEDPATETSSDITSATTIANETNPQTIESLGNYQTTTTASATQSISTQVISTEATTNSDSDIISVSSTSSQDFSSESPATNMCGAGITEKRDPRGVTTDLLDV